MHGIPERVNAPVARDHSNVVNANCKGRIRGKGSSWTRVGVECGIARDLWAPDV